MRYKIIFPRPVLEWICSQVLPNIELTANARMDLYTKTDVEYLNNGIIKYIMLEVAEILNHERDKEYRNNRTVKLNHCQVLTFFRFLHNYPVFENENWKNVQKKYLLRQMVEHIPELKEFLL